MLSFSVKIDETVTAKSEAVIRKVIAAKAATVVKDHFVALGRARHRGGSFNFYGRAARATSHGVSGQAAFVSIDQEGIALRRYGGTVRPRKGKYLTIPADKSAHGKRAREFGNLHFRRNASGDSGRLCDPAGRVFYWLIKQSTHKPDPSVLPTDAEIQTAATAAMQDWVELTEDRAK